MVCGHTKNDWDLIFHFYGEKIPSNEHRSTTDMKRTLNQHDSVHGVVVNEGEFFLK